MKQILLILSLVLMVGCDFNQKQTPNARNVVEKLFPGAEVQFLPVSVDMFLARTTNGDVYFIDVRHNFNAYYYQTNLVFRGER